MVASPATKHGEALHDLAPRTARAAQQRGEVASSVERRQQRRHRRGDDGTTRRIVHQHATEVRRGPGHETCDRAHVASFVEGRGDAADAILVTHDLGGDVRQTELVDRGLAHRGVACPALALDEIAGRDAYAIRDAFDGAAPYQVEIVVATVDELARRELAWTEPRDEGGDDLGRQVADRAVPLEERVGDEQVGALAHRGREQRLPLHERCQLAARKAQHHARGVRHDRRAARRVRDDGELADQRGWRDERERSVVTGHDAQGPVDEEVRVGAGAALLDERLAFPQAHLARGLAQAAPHLRLEEQEGTEPEGARHAAPPR